MMVLGKGFCQTIRNGYYIREYGSSQGFYGTQCTYSFRDHQGTFWLSCEQGLYSFDGTEFRLYTDTSRTTSRGYQTITEDSKGRLYLLRRDGVFLFSPRAAQPFRKLYTSKKKVSICSLVAVDTNDFYIIDNERDRVNWEMKRIFNGKAVAFNDIEDRVMFLTRDNEYVYAHTASDHIYVFKAGKVVSDYDIKTTLYVPYVWPPYVRDATGATWLMAATLCKLGPHGVTDSLPLPGTSESSYYQVAMGPRPREYYAMSAGRLAHYNGTSLNTVTYVNQSVTDTAANGICTGLYADNDGTLWAMNIPIGFRQIKKLEFADAGSDNYWIASSDGRNGLVYTYDSLFRRHPFLNSPASRALNATGYYENRAGSLLSILPDGIITIQKKEDKLSRVLFRSDDIRAAQRKIFSIIEDKRGTYWCIGSGSIVHILEDTFKAYPRISSNFRFCLDQENRLWAPNGTAELFVCDDDTARDIAAQLPIRMNKISSVASDMEGNIWIGGSGRVIYRITPGNKSTYTCSDSLVLDDLAAGMDVQSIGFDHYGNLWATLPNRVYIFPADKQGALASARHIQLTPDDGIMSYLQGGYYLFNKTADSNICSTMGSRYVLNVKNILNSYSKRYPKAYLSGVLLFNKEPDWRADGFTLREDGLPDQPSFRYDQNTLTFNFSSIGFHNAPYFRYQYRLQGLEDEWQEGDETRKATYRNLRSGSYTFVVRAANENGAWGAESRYMFTISPPWYYTWWAWAIWILLGIGIIITIAYLRQRAIIRELKTEQQLTEQKLIALRAQINPHFLQNTFAFLAQTVVHETKEATVSAIKKISAYLRGILNASDHSVVTVEDELKFTEEYLALQKILFGNRISYKITTGDEVDTFGVEVPSMLLQPLVENAIKYGTRNDNTCMVHIEVVQDGNYITCTIRDNGELITETNKDPKHVSKGIAITKSKLELMFSKRTLKPEVTLVPNTERGFTATIKIPLR